MNDCESKVLMYIQYTFAGFAFLRDASCSKCFAFGSRVETGGSIAFINTVC